MLRVVLHFYEMFKNYRKVKIPIRGKKYNLVVSDSPEKKRIGLSKVRSLPSGCGMLFVYGEPVNHAFTMEKTSIPLTIIFLDKNMNIVDVFKCRPYEKRKVRPASDYSYVIEI